MVQLARVLLLVTVAGGLLWGGLMLLPFPAATDSAATMDGQQEQLRQQFERIMLEQDAEQGRTYSRQLRSEFPAEYNELIDGMVRLVREGRSEDEAFAYGAVWGQSFVRRHWPEAMRASPPVLVRLLDAQHALITDLARTDQEACARYFEGSADIGTVREVTQSSREPLAAYNDAVMAAIIDGRTTRYAYPLSMDENYRAFLNRAQAAADDEEALMAVGTSGSSTVSAERRCRVAVAVFNSLSQGSMDQRASNYARLMTPRN
jgi:hypothetical protein